MNVECPICAELLKATENISCTVCGHMFHQQCLNQWLARSRTCPKCRKTLYDIDNNIRAIKVYFTEANLDSSRVDVGLLQEQLTKAKIQIKHQEKYHKRELESTKITVGLLQDQLENTKFQIRKNEENHQRIIDDYTRKFDQAYAKVMQENTCLKNKNTYLASEIYSLKGKMKKAEEKTKLANIRLMNNVTRQQDWASENESLKKKLKEYEEIRLRKTSSNKNFNGASSYSDSPEPQGGYLVPPPPGIIKSRSSFIRRATRCTEKKM